jgi:hypothetical protein
MARIVLMRSSAEHSIVQELASGGTPGFCGAGCRAVEVRRNAQMQLAARYSWGRCLRLLLARRRLSQKLTMPRRSRPWLLKSPGLPQGNPSAPQLVVDPGLACRGAGQLTPCWRQGRHALPRPSGSSAGTLAGLRTRPLVSRPAVARADVRGRCAGFARSRRSQLP